MTLNPAPRIGIIGTGAIGGFYGLLLARAGFDVHFLLRSEYSAVAANGLQLNSQVHGALHLQPVQAYRHAEDMPACDWLLVGAKTTANAELAPLINQAAAPGARVVLLQNGLGVETALRPLLDDGLHLLGGLCYICVHRSAPGVIEHQALGAINLAYHSGPAEDDEARRSLVDDGAELFRKAGLDSQTMAKLEQTRWQKLVWNVPYNGLSVLLDADTKAMMGNPSSRALIRDMMLEVVQAAQALGHDMPENYADKLLAATERMPDYLPSMYHDFAQRRPAELQAIYATPLAAAAAAGQDMPKVRALYQALQFLQARQEA
ncbi:putative 2-dehydropantoate 2-reductase [Pseudomonas sp. NCHU5208]|uniref:putative 2-dehydropantoate 2-reductase n=1 Tax=unclassified Pseudomonas TaxID=196821 RepID=UPI003F9441DF